MALNLKDLKKKIDKSLREMTHEEWEACFPKDTRPTGWISIEDSLPEMYAIDIMKGYSEYKVKYADNTESTTKVADHNTWYYFAKETGITHWWHD